MGCSDAVWRESADTEVLRALFGYLPTLHDARVRDVALGMAARTVTLVVDYTDLPEGGERSIDVRLSLQFADVTVLELPLEVTDIIEFHSTSERSRVVTRVLMSGGEWLVVESGSFEISLARVGPDRDQESARLRAT